MTLVDFLEVVKSGGAGLSIVFAVLYWLERMDNRKATQEMIRGLTKVIHALDLLRERMR